MNWPQTIPRRRGNRTQCASLIISTVIILVGSLYTSNKLFYILASWSTYTIMVLLVEVVFRIASLCEEFQHVTSRYRGNNTTLFYDAFTFSPLYYVLCILSTFVVFYVHYEYGANPFVETYDFGLVPNLCLVFGVMLGSRLFRLDHGPLYQSTLMTKLNGLDYGSAMAYSFFNGYLQIVLPYKGTEQKGIKELMEDFESNEDIKFAIHKLLVLIPLSLYCPTSLVDGSKLVELSKSLGEIKLTRGGVRDRIYKNTVYKIKKKYYVCAEYATPLQTLLDIVSHNNQHANHYKKHGRELVLNFYLTLKNIMKENPDCGDYCELIFYDDSGENGKRIDVGTIILNHLEQLSRTENDKND